MVAAEPPWQADEPDYLDVDVVEDSGALPAGVAAAESSRRVMAAEDDRAADEDEARRRSRG